MLRGLMVLAALAAFLLALPPAAPAATTTYDLRFSNGTGKPLVVQVYGSGFNSRQDLPVGGQVNFNIQDSAHFLKDVYYHYSVNILDADGNNLGSMQGSVVNVWDAGPKEKQCNLSGCDGRLSCQVSKQTPNRGTCQFFITVGNR